MNEGSPRVVDVRDALLDLLNLRDRGEPYALEGTCNAFIARYGHLREIPFPEESLKQLTNGKHQKDNPVWAVRTASMLVRSLFQHPYDDETESQGIENINLGLKIIFGPAVIDGEERDPALKVDILSGTLAPQPRDLLDRIAVEFMRSHRFISNCQRCGRYFFKQYSTDRYCSLTCANAARSEAQRDWMRAKRAKDKELKLKKPTGRKRK